MRRVLCVALALLSPALRAQDTTKLYTWAVAQLVVAKSLSDTLAKMWDDHTVYQKERAYCVAWRGVIVGPHQVRIDLDSLVHFEKPQGVATPYQVPFSCPEGSAPLHTHTPITCESPNQLGLSFGVCRYGGADAWECYPSVADVQNLIASPQYPFALIQCDTHALVPYFRPTHP